MQALIVDVDHVIAEQLGQLPIVVIEVLLQLGQQLVTEDRSELLRGLDQTLAVKEQ